jgi:hypothetical protein
MKNKTKFIYELKSNKYGNAFFSSISKAKKYLKYLETNGNLSLKEEHPDTGNIIINNEYEKNLLITIYRRQLNIY